LHRWKYRDVRHGNEIVTEAACRREGCRFQGDWRFVNAEVDG